VDLAAGRVLPLVDVLPLLRRQLASVACAVGGNRAVDILLALLHVRRLVCIHGSIANAVGNALLLVIAPGAHFGVAVLRRLPVVLVVVNRLAQVVLLLVHLLPLLLCQGSAVGLTVGPHFAVDVGFAAFQVLGFACRQLPARYAVRNAPLLVVVASAHRV